MIVAVAGELATLRELQSRALEAVARRWAWSPDAPGPDAPGPDAAVLSAADSSGLRRTLHEVVETTGLLAEAARQVASVVSAGPPGWSRAVETADAISTTAQALRMLAEIELAAIPDP